MANLTRRDPFDEMLAWDRAMTRLFDQFYGVEGPAFSDRMNQYMPLDMIEKENEFIVKADLAGIDPEDVEVTTTHNSLTIKGESRAEKEESEKEGRYHLRERRYGAFVRTLTLPDSVDVDQIKAESQNGVLVLHLPKKEKVKPKRVEVKVNQKGKVIDGNSK